MIMNYNNVGALIRNNFEIKITRIFEKFFIEKRERGGKRKRGGEEGENICVDLGASEGFRNLKSPQKSPLARPR